MNKSYIGEGKVVLIAGGGRVYTDMAARFCRSEKDLENIIASPYDANIVKNIISSGHKAATEFDYFIFGIEGYSRVTEVQLVRKRMASYLIKSGRCDKNGKRSYDVVLPDNLNSFVSKIKLNPSNVFINDRQVSVNSNVELLYNSDDLLGFLEEWYNSAVVAGIPEEDARYLKPQATEFKAIVGMNAHALMDWFQIRCCMNAQAEIRDLAYKMLNLCKDAAPDLFAQAGPSCKVFGYCPENKLQHNSCKGKIYTKNEALEILSYHKRGN